jgi:hypothetical protein
LEAALKFFNANKPADGDDFANIIDGNADNAEHACNPRPSEPPNTPLLRDAKKNRLAQTPPSWHLTAPADQNAKAGTRSHGTLQVRRLHELHHHQPPESTNAAPSEMNKKAPYSSTMKLDAHLKRLGSSTPRQQTRQSSASPSRKSRETLRHARAGEKTPAKSSSN